MRAKSVFTAGVALLLAVPAAASAASGVDPVAAVRPVLAGGAPLNLSGAHDFGLPPAAAHQRVVLVLGLRNRAGLDRLIAAQSTPGSSSYQQWLSPEQFAARFSPTAAAVRTATDWARSAGLTVTEVSSNRTLVTLEGTHAQLGRALHVTLRRKLLGAETYLTPDRPITLPAAVSRTSVALLGLTTYRAFRTQHAVAPAAGSGTLAVKAYTPVDFADTYNLPNSFTGTGQSVAVITSGDISEVPSDLRRFETYFGLRRVPMSIVQTTPEGGTDKDQIEYDLDTQAATTFAPGAKSVIAYNGAELGDIHPLNAVVTKKRVKTASASYGGCEFFNLLLGDLAADDQVFMQADAQGQTFFVSSGDTGSACAPFPVISSVPHNVSYPASSRYVVAVGGTTLTDAAQQPEREVTWDGGGGGQSLFESAPPWQTSAGLFQTRLGRGVPDVSLDADPKSGYFIFVHGKPALVGGTSASAPAWNGIWARVLQTHAKAGFAAPALYQRSGPALVDITLGRNGDYAAAKGYDLATGLGSVDVRKLLQRIAI